jgi:hypothetical protein
MTLKLYLISQTVNDTYNTFDSAVVVAETEEQAKRIHPCDINDPRYNYPSWTTSDNVTCQLLSENVSGDLQAGQVVCASFWNS